MAASAWTLGRMPTRPVDMHIGPEDPRPFVELASTLGQDRIPWRCAFVLEGCGQSAMQLKDIGASFLSMFPGNADLRRALRLSQARRAQKDNHISVRAARELRDLGAGGAGSEAAPPGIHTVSAHRGLGQREIDHGRRRSAGGRR